MSTHGPILCKEFVYASLSKLHLLLLLFDVLPLEERPARAARLSF
eukprot:COSAG02_NODE_51449_length_314_cov_0.711628_1_plen_44_part_10